MDNMNKKDEIEIRAHAEASDNLRLLILEETRKFVEMHRKTILKRVERRIKEMKREDGTKL